MGFFSDLTGNNSTNSLSNSVLGPKYDYAKNINPPKNLGMSSRGTINQAAKNVAGLIDYTELLVTGQGKASKTGRPLGNKFFLKTGQKCKDVDSKQLKTRYIYINNVPTGNIPFISSALGGSNFSSFKGLIPGTLTSVGQLNPLKLFQSFMMKSEPDCKNLSMETISVNNQIGSATHHVALMDIKNLDPCLFSNKRNPITKKGCVEAFTTENDEEKNILEYMYYSGLSVVLLYIIFKLISKNNK